MRSRPSRWNPTRRPISTRSMVARAFVLILLGLWAAAPAVAQQPDETLPGFNPATAYETHQIDNINLFSGDPGVSIPLGPEYPLGPGFTWQLRAYNSTKLWELTTSGCPPIFGYPDSVKRAYAYGDSAAGLGWFVDLGYVGAPGTTPRYISPDGGRHEPFLATNGITDDGARLRILCSDSTHCTVEFPNGIVHNFTHPYQTLRPTNVVSYDLVDQNGSRLGLTSITDKFGSTLLSVGWLASSGADAAKVSQIHLNPGTSQARDITYAWGTDTSNGVTWPVLTKITFPSAAGSGHDLIASLGFDTTHPILKRHIFDTSDPWPQCLPDTSVDVYVPFLKTIAFADSASPTVPIQTFTLAYFNDGTRGKKNGALNHVAFPTGGTLDYTYDSYQGLDPSCSDPLTLESCGPTPLAGIVQQPEDPGNPCIDFITQSPILASRTEKASGSDPGIVTSYVRGLMIPDFCATNDDRYRMTKIVLAYEPTGSGGQKVTKYLFHVTPPLPVVRGLDGAEIERRYYADTNYGGTPLRTVVRCYEGDTNTDGDATHCGYLANATTIQRYHISGNVRELSSVAWFGTNPTGGGSCVSGSVYCTADVRSGWVSGSLRYKTDTITSTLPSTGGLTSRVSTANWTPQTPAGTWLLDLFSSKVLTDSGSVSSPTSITSTYSFDSSTGFLNSTSTADSTYGTLAHTYTPDGDGNPSTEILAGSGGTGSPLTGSFTDTRAFASGLATSRTRSGITWKPFDVDRDPDTGRITRSRDPNSLATSFGYDVLGRISSVTPPGSDLATSITWDSANQKATVVRGSGAAGTWNRYVYDGLGRLIREIRRMPGTAKYAFRAHGYDSAGHPNFDSEWKSCVDTSNDCLTLSASGTTRSSFDLLGRAQTITAADGATTTVSYADGSITASDTLKTVTIKNVGGTCASGSCTGGSSAVSEYRYDPLGRLISVKEPSVTGSATNRTTDYVYNVLDKIGKVTQKDDAPTPNVQTRTFVYDKNGLLRSETTPEKGAVNYNEYNALGGLVRKTEPDGILTRRCYDAAGRVTYLLSGEDGTTPSCTGPAGRIYASMAYDENPSTTAPLNYSLGRQTTRKGMNYALGPGPTVVETFQYGDSAGRLSGRSIAVGQGVAATPTNAGENINHTNEAWSYDGLGDVVTHKNPGSGLYEANIGYDQGYEISTNDNGVPLVTAVDYTPAGSLATWTAATTPNPTVLTITPDSSGIPRPSQITGGFSSGAYSYDGAGNIMKIGTDQFTYDLRSRVLTANYGSSQAYAYDRFGNITSKAGIAVGVSPTTNRLTSFNGIGVGYDARGNLASFGTTELMVYDGLNRQVTEVNGSVRWDYLYDGASERVAKVPSNPVLRREMARYIAQARGELQVNVACVSGHSFYFTDVFCSNNVLADDPDRKWIDKFAQDGITSGCGANLFCPGNTVHRDQMAVFFVKALGQQPVANSSCHAPTRFTDVPCNYDAGGALPNAWGFIEQFAIDGITVGCGSGKYCPGDATTEMQMLAFLNKAWPGYRGVARGTIYTLRDPSNRVEAEYWSTPGGDQNSFPRGTQSARNNVYIGGLLVASKVTSDIVSPIGWTYLFSDHLGTPRRIVNASGAQIETWKYWPYGAEFTSTNSTQFHRYGGMERDPEAFHLYDHARTHDYNFGRFLSPDTGRSKPLVPQSWNRYSYALSNPLKLIDPDGLEGVWVINTYAANGTNYDLGLSKAVSVNLAASGVAYLTAGQYTNETLQDLINDPTNQVILLGHSVLNEEHVTTDFLVDPNWSGGEVGKDQRLIGSGIAESPQAQSVSILSCGSSMICGSEGLQNTPGAVLATVNQANQTLYFAQQLGKLLNSGVALDVAMRQAEKFANSQKFTEPVFPIVAEPRKACDKDHPSECPQTPANLEGQGIR